MNYLWNTFLICFIVSTLILFTLFLVYVYLLLYTALELLVEQLGCLMIIFKPKVSLSNMTEPSRQIVNRWCLLLNHFFEVIKFIFISLIKRISLIQVIR